MKIIKQFIHVVMSLMILFVPIRANAHSLTFAGEDDYAFGQHIEAYHKVPINLFISFELNVLSSDIGRDQVLISKSAGAGYSWQLSVGIDNKLHFRTNSGQGADIESDQPLTIQNEMNVFVSMYANHKIKMYIEHVLQKDQDKSPRLNKDQPGDLTIGAEEPSSKSFKGTIYDIKFWQTDPHKLNVKNIMNQIWEEDGMVAHWGFQDVKVKVDPATIKLVPDTDRSTVLEDSKGGHHLTLNGGSWNLDTITLIIDDDYADRYWPGPLTGTMNIGIERETPVDPNDHSWRKMPQDLIDLHCENQYHIDDDGSDKSGDGSLRNPYASLGKAMRHRTQHGNCFFIHAGVYYGDYWLAHLKNNNPHGDHMMWISGWDDGEAILRDDKTHLLNWEPHDENIYKAKWSVVTKKRSPGQVILDDNWPYCCYKKWDGVDELEFDGDWYFDSKTRMFYIHTSGKHPAKQRNIIMVEDNRDNSNYLFYGVSMSHVGLWGLTMVGAGSYAVLLFKKHYDRNIGNHVINNTFKYMNEGTIAGPQKQNKFWRNRVHAVTMVNGGIGNAGHAFGSAGGWPSAVGGSRQGAIGNIITHIRGEGIGGAGRNKKKSGQNAQTVVEDNIVMQSWSVQIYPDTVQNFRLRNNFIFQHVYLPYEAAPSKKIVSGGSTASVRRRLLGDCILFGDETAETLEEVLAAPNRSLKSIVQTDDLSSEHIDVSNNVCIGLTRGFNFNHGGGAKLSGLKYIDVVNNIFILPNFDGLSLGTGWGGFTNSKDERSGAHVGSHIHNNIVINPHISGLAHSIRIGDKSMLDVDYNYYFINERTMDSGYKFKRSIYDFEKYKNISKQDQNSIHATIDQDGNLLDPILKRSNWNLRGDFRVKMSDFELSAGSTAVNTGSMLIDNSFRRDFEEKKRPLGGGWDIGIFEQGEWTPNVLNSQFNLRDGGIK